MEADQRAPRLFVEGEFASGQSIALTREQSHYLVHVMRSRAGTVLRVFNGNDGEWLAELDETTRKHSAITLIRQIRPQVPLGRISWLFAPLKQARLDYMVQKAVEMGVVRMQPVLTQHTMVQRLNLDRMRANAIEAAEQCHLLAIPAVEAEMKLDKAIAALSDDTVLVFCDEGADLVPPVKALQAVPQNKPVAVLIGPEGGFSEKERGWLLDYPNVIRLSLGPRIMRADTAAVAALTLVQAVCGDLA
jgi:16S rRNA (uracil1498-N3)-methyltransferase